MVTIAPYLNRVAPHLRARIMAKHHAGNAGGLFQPRRRRISTTSSEWYERQCLRKRRKVMVGLCRFNEAILIGLFIAISVGQSIP